MWTHFVNNCVPKAVLPQFRRDRADALHRGITVVFIASVTGLRISSSGLKSTNAFLPATKSWPLRSLTLSSSPPFSTGLDHFDPAIKASSFSISASLASITFFKPKLESFSIQAKPRVRPKDQLVR